MDSSDIFWLVIILAFFVAVGWDKYCEHRWPVPREPEEE
jgi:hypothetical protein